MTPTADAPKRQVAALLNPLGRLSEVLFGLIMAVAIVGSTSVAAGGQRDVRALLLAALDCNLAWGLVDAVMYLVRTLAGRTDLRAVARRVRVAPAEAGRVPMRKALPDGVASVNGPEQLEARRQRLVALPVQGGSVLHRVDDAGAPAIFGMVALATFPLVLTFGFRRDAALAQQV